MSRRILFTSIFAAICIAGVGQIPVPTGLSTELVETDTMNYVLLRWDGKSPQDSLTVGYNVLTNFPPHEELMLSQRVGVQYDTSFLYPIGSVRGGKYRFALMALNNFPKVERSAMSSISEILVPSTQIPHVSLKKVKKEKNNLIVTWDYPNGIADLSGFNIYMNEQLYKKTSASSRQIKYPLDEEGTFVFQVQAFTDNIESKPSQKRLIKVEN